MKRTVTLIVLGIILAGGGGYVGWREYARRSVRRDPTVAGADHTVVMRGGVFVPDRLEIRVGESVAWLNDEDVLHWPASDPHPTHTGAPGLDALGELRRGENFRYTFNATGTFPYHDHAVAKQIGAVDYPRATIVVNP